MFKNIIIVILSLSLIGLIFAYEKQSKSIIKYAEEKVTSNYISMSKVPSQKIKIPRLSHTKKEMKKIKKIIVRKISLSSLLRQDRFYDALSLYLDNTTSTHKREMEAYLKELATKNPLLALEYMQSFFDEEPSSLIWKEIIKTHLSQDNYIKAIAYIRQMREQGLVSSEERHLSVQLKEVAKNYIDVLLKRKSYALLISFLEEMIAYDEESAYYSFELAKLYATIEKKEESIALLETLAYDDVYEEQAKTLLETLTEETTDAYRYEIPLVKYGAHYVASVFLNNVPFKLMLDTGATYIFVDEDKASAFEIIRDDVRLRTAGNEIEAKLAKTSLRVGEISLSQLKVTIAPFKRKGIDGLLGMNFFKHFEFQIDQTKNLLLLNPKD